MGLPLPPAASPRSTFRGGCFFMSPPLWGHHKKTRKSIFEVNLKKQGFQGAQPRQRRDVVLTVPVKGWVLGEGSPSLRKQADFLTLKNLPSPELTERGTPRKTVFFRFLQVIVEIFPQMCYTY